MGIVASLFAFLVMLFLWLAVIADPPEFMPEQVLQGTFIGLMLIALALFLHEVFEPDYDDDDALTRVVKKRARRVKARFRGKRRGGWV